jgi:hypothetical protein
MSLTVGAASSSACWVRTAPARPPSSRRSRAACRRRPAASFAPLDGLQAHHVVGRGICHYPEAWRLFPELSVLRNLMLGTYLRSDRGASGPHALDDDDEIRWIYLGA